MEDVYKGSMKFIAFLFGIVFLTIFLQGTDFFGAMLDEIGAKEEIVNSSLFEKSMLNEDDKFERHDISVLINLPEYKKEITKFGVIDKYEKTYKEKVKVLKILYLTIVLAGLISFILIVFTNSFLVVILLEIVFYILFFMYNTNLDRILKELKLENQFYSVWGLGESIQNAAVATILLTLIFVPIKKLLKGEKIELRKITIAENVSTIKKAFVSLKKRISRNLFSYLMLLPALVIVFLIILYPFLFNIEISFSNLSIKRIISFISANKLDYNGIKNYLEIFGLNKILNSNENIKISEFFNDVVFWKVLFRTIIWTLISVFFHLVFGVILAIVLNRDKVKYKGIFQALLIVPWAIPQFIAVLIWKGMYDNKYGVINIMLDPIVSNPVIQQGLNTVLGPFGKEVPASIPWLSDPFWLFVGAIICNIWLGVPFMMMIALGGLQSISKTYYESADIDGASDLQKFRFITIPLLMPIMAPAIIISSVWTFNNLNVIYLLSLDKLTGKVDILVTYVYKAAFILYKYGYAAAFSIIIFFILILFSILLIKSDRTIGGVQR